MDNTLASYIIVALFGFFIASIDELGLIGRLLVSLIITPECVAEGS